MKYQESKPRNVQKRKNYALLHKYEIRQFIIELHISIMRISIIPLMEIKLAHQKIRKSELCNKATN